MPEHCGHVYIIDDDKSVCKALARLMRTAGYSSDTYQDGEAFLVEGHYKPAAKVICDLSMPGLNGLEVYRQARERHLDLPFIFISGAADQGWIVEAKRAGVAFFRKPVDADELLAALEQCPAIEN